MVGRYRVDDFVAEGGMGQVFRAWDSTLERRVALKVIRADHAGEKAALIRFQREAQILAKLDHPGICHVYDWLDHSGTLVMAMEWVDGEPLSKMIERGPLPVPQVLRLLKEVALALAAAHGKGVIHRDLKPSNILITPEGAAKILDFGLAKSLGAAAAEDSEHPGASPGGEEDSTVEASDPITALSQPGTILGTRGFLAPELLMGEGGSARADMYALGVLAFMALTGEPNHPHQVDGNPWARRLLKRRAGSGAHPVLGPKAALWALVDRLLSQDPESRPGAQAVVTALGRIQAPASPMWWATATAALTLLLVGLGAWVYGRGAIPEFSVRRPARMVVTTIRNLTPMTGLTPAVEITTTELLEHVLRSLPKVQIVADRIPDRSGQGIRPRLGALEEEAEQDFIRRIVARTGADLVLMGEVLLVPGSDQPLLRVRLLDRKGNRRSGWDVPSPASGYEPNLAVSSVFNDFSRAISPLHRDTSPQAVPPREALEAYGRGRDLADRGAFTQAIPFLERAALKAPEFAPAILHFAWTLMLAGDSRALSTFMWARAAARDSGDRNSEVQVLVQLAHLVRRNGNPETLSGEDLLKEALSLSVAIGDPDLQALVLNQLGDHWLIREDATSAASMFNSALEKTQSSGNHALRFSILVNLANLEKYRGRSTAARSQYLAADGEARGLENPWFEAISRSNLALLDLEEGRLDGAERVFQEVLQLRRQLGDIEGEHRVLVNLGVVAFMRGAFEVANTRFETALIGARKYQLTQIQGRLLYRLGDVLRAQGRLTLASGRLQAAMELLRKAGTPGNQAAALAALAECRVRQAQSVEAERLIAEALRIAGNRPQVWRAQAWLQRQQGKKAEALESLSLALADPRCEDPEHHEETRALISAWRRES
ncbi:MAG: protein kinase [Holophagaceae bacterium]|uniref:Protein kinase n=1 Tax=Candidatus Geothrix skivensis TaxID=2954439 RepID=A0A9D7SDQ0_9BACT|nr:protein kinase [Candidatus Geothrix skivensis]